MSRAQALGMEGYFLLLALAAFIFSLGPILQIAGSRVWIPLPYAIAYYLIPGLSGMRAPARFASLTLLGLVVIAGIGYRRLRSMPRVRKSLLGNILVIALFGSAIACAWARPTPMLELPSAENMPAVYRWLAKAPDSLVVLEIPVPANDRDEDPKFAIRQYLALFHGKRRVDGVSGFVSNRYRKFRTEIQEFPSEVSLDAAEAMGANLIIVHLEEYDAVHSQELRQSISAESRLIPRAAIDGALVLELRPVVDNL